MKRKRDDNRVITLPSLATSIPRDDSPSEVTILSAIGPEFGMDTSTCQTCNRAFSSPDDLREHLGIYQSRIRELITQLYNAYAHTEEHQSTTPYTDDGDIPTEGDSGDHLCPYRNCGSKTTTRWNLQRHYTTHIEIEQLCPICGKQFTLVSTLILHIDFCKNKKNAKTPDMARVKRFVRGLNKLASEKLKAVLVAKDISADELSLHPEDTCPPRKRRCTDGTVLVESCPTNRTDGYDQVHGETVDEAASQVMPPFTVNLNPQSTLLAEAALAGSVASGPLGSASSHPQASRAPFLTGYNLDQSEVAADTQTPRAPFFSRYNVDHPQVTQNSSQPLTSSQSCGALSGFPVNHIINHHTQQTGYTYPYVIAGARAVGNMSEKSIDAQIASGGAIYGNSEDVQYRADPRLYAKTTPGAALLVDNMS